MENILHLLDTWKDLLSFLFSLSFLVIALYGINSWKRQKLYDKSEKLIPKIIDLRKDINTAIYHYFKPLTVYTFFPEKERRFVPYPYSNEQLTKFNNCFSKVIDGLKYITSSYIYDSEFRKAAGVEAENLLNVLWPKLLNLNQDLWDAEEKFRKKWNRSPLGGIEITDDLDEDKIKCNNILDDHREFMDIEIKINNEIEMVRDDLIITIEKIEKKLGINL